MASLNTLRTKGGVIVTIVIFVALIAFLLGDFFSAGSSMFNSRKMRVGEIEGNNIGYVEFLNQSEYMSNIYSRMWNKDALSTQEQEMVYNTAWEQLIMKYAYAPAFKKLGFLVSNAEQVDMINGVYLSPVITSTFVNPSTGSFDAELLKNFLGNVGNDNVAYAIWEFLKNQMNQNRLMTKYFALVSGGFFANDLEVEQGLAAANTTYGARVVSKSYSDVPDSLVNVTSAEIRKYYDEHKRMFRQGESRDVEYVVFDVFPSEEDYAEAKKYIDEVAAEFATTDTPMQYATLNSQKKPDTRYYKESDLDTKMAAIAFGKDAGKMYGPVLNNDVYTISRLSDTRMLPDTIGARHILLAKDQKALADSLVGVIRKGSDFATLAATFSQDPTAAQNGGDLGHFAPEQMIPEFSEACIAARQGDVFTVESMYGLHVVNLTYKTKSVKKAQIATIIYRVDPSATTQQKIYTEANSFLAAAAGGYDAFKQAVNDAALSKRNVRIRNTDRTISGLDDAKELIRWSFNNKAGTVSQIMEIDENYVIAALAEVRKEGIAPVEQVAAQIRATLLNKAKAAYLANEMKGGSLDEIASAVGVEPKSVGDLQFSSFYVPEFGAEPRLIGAICGGAAEKTLSKPVEGFTALYLFEVDSVTTTEEATAESEKVRLDATALYYVNERCIQALAEESDIKDMRVKFF